MYPLNAGCKALCYLSTLDSLINYLMRFPQDRMQWSPLRQEPEAPLNNATSRNCALAPAWLSHARVPFPPPAGAGGCQGAG